MTRTQPPPGFTLPRVLSSTLVDRDAPDLELEVINKLLPLLADKSHTVFDLCDVSGLNFDELATLLESPRVDKAYRAMVRILAIRQKFIDAQSHFVTTAQLLSIASAQPMDAKEADQSRKAANKLHALTPQWDGLPARLPTKPDGLEARPTTGQPRPSSPAECTSQAQDTPLTPTLSPPSGAREPGQPHHPIAGFPLPTLVTQLHASCGSCRSCHATP
jgi:hypothetical protein